MVSKDPILRAARVQARAESRAAEGLTGAALDASNARAEALRVIVKARLEELAVQRKIQEELDATEAARRARAFILAAEKREAIARMADNLAEQAYKKKSLAVSAEWLQEGVAALPQELYDAIADLVFKPETGPIAITKFHTPPSAMQVDRSTRAAYKKEYYGYGAMDAMASMDNSAKYLPKWVAGLSCEALSFLKSRQKDGTESQIVQQGSTFRLDLERACTDLFDKPYPQRATKVMWKETLLESHLEAQLE